MSVATEELTSRSSRFRYNQALMNQYVALLRGINVGGKNLIKMTELKACFEALGFTNVSTYIQSGNVLFSADKSARTTLTSQVENALSRTFNYKSRVVVRSYKELKILSRTRQRASAAIQLPTATMLFF